MSQPSLLDLLEKQAPAEPASPLVEAADHIRRQNRALTRCYNQLNDICQNAMVRWQIKDSGDELMKFQMMKRIRGLQREIKDLLRTDAGPYSEEMEIESGRCCDD
jgi:hypothetical protein